MRTRVRAILLSLTAVIGYITVSTVAYTITEDAVLSALTVNMVMTAIIFGMRTRMHKHPFVQARHVSRTEIALTPLMIIAVNITATVTALWVKQHTASTTLNEQALGDAPVVLLLLLGLVLAPLGEETLVRGLVYPVLRRGFSAPVTIAVTSAVFSLMHGNLAQIVLTVPLGVVLGYLYERTHRLSLCVAAHSLFNLTAMLLPSRQIEGVTAPVVAALATVALITVWILATQRMGVKMNDQP